MQHVLSAPIHEMIGTHTSGSTLRRDLSHMSRPYRSEKDSNFDVTLTLPSSLGLHGKCTVAGAFVEAGAIVSAVHR